MLTGEILRRSADRFPNKPAIIAQNIRMTYRELDAAANCFAHALIAAGIGKGDKIGIMCANLPAYPVVYFGAAKAGAVLANFSVRATANDVAYMLDMAEVRIFVVQEEHAAVAAAAVGNASALERVVIVGEPKGTGIAGAVGFAAFMGGRSADEPGVALAETDPLAITFTGGTTGKPRAVLVSHRARYVNNVTGAVQFGVCETDIAAVATPMFHAAGLFIWFQLCILLGLTCVLLPAWDAESFIEATEAEGITAAFLVPTQIRDVIEHPAFDARKLRTLRSIDYAGSPMRIEALRAAMDKLPSVVFTEHLGQSETGPIAVRQHWQPSEKHGSVGRQALGVETRVVDRSGRRVKPGEVGEVVTRGEHLLIEYFNDPEQTAALFRNNDGWLWTGDLATVDEDGFITLVDRSKDMIISGGENIYPKEIEDALLQHAAVAECAVFGVPDERLGEVPAAHVVLRNGEAAAADALIEFCAGLIARHKRPRLVAFVDQIPKSAIGKVQKHLIRAPYWAGRDRPI